MHQHHPGRAGRIDGGALSLVGGHSGEVTLGGSPFHVRLGGAFSGVEGTVMCSDMPGSWINLLIAPKP